ncbi:excinuclease ABC subunit UvrC [Anaerovibrio sp.]|uniref:excinuclease ABC subunit UvrC n=1 Tax=Anaerovibrio sp. TaxID=1872532 RepID=UPI003F1516E4
MNDNIAEKLTLLPNSPGVYIMKDAAGTIIYVGKAVVLKNRVSQYFQQNRGHSAKVKAMVARIADFDIIMTGTEVEALILECKLIKKYRPKYNISLKDDKMYPYLKVTTREDFPRVFITRRFVRDGSRYFGPYTDVGALKDCLKLLKRMFPLRSCRNIRQGQSCLEYHIRRCLAPCIGRVSREEYRSMIRRVCLFLDGRTKQVEVELKAQMEKAAEALEFELAARLRDQLLAVQKLSEMQKLVSKPREDELAIQERVHAQTIGAVEELGEYLGLAVPPYRMECFDISHNQGSETVASMVVFEGGTAKKSDYRRFKIRSAEGKPDDFKSMREVTMRRYGASEAELPDLIVIDGGKGQLSSALEIIRGAGHLDVPVVGLAKREEEVFCEGCTEPVILPRDSQALFLIQRIRDEAHRFAITYHRKLRGRRNLASILDHIEGIGPKRRQLLYEHYGSIDRIKEAPAEEMASLDGMNRPSAEAVYNFFRAQEKLTN